MPGTLVAHLLERFRGREPRWRQLVADNGIGGHLTSREWEVLALLAKGLSTGAIVRRLMLSSSAVRVHIAAIVRKLGVPDREAAIKLFRERSET